MTTTYEQKRQQNDNQVSTKINKMTTKYQQTRQQNDNKISTKIQQTSPSINQKHNKTMISCDFL